MASSGPFCRFGGRAFAESPHHQRHVRVLFENLVAAVLLPNSPGSNLPSTRFLAFAMFTLFVYTYLRPYFTRRRFVAAQFWCFAACSGVRQVSQDLFSFGISRMANLVVLPLAGDDPFVSFCSVLFRFRGWTTAGDEGSTLTSLMTSSSLKGRSREKPSNSEPLSKVSNDVGTSKEKPSDGSGVHGMVQGQLDELERLRMGIETFKLWPKGAPGNRNGSSSLNKLSMASSSPNEMSKLATKS